MPNTQWRIAYGDYDFAIDRQTLAYSLTETKTGTVWADGLSTGWIELEERESGVRTRYNFADAKLISVAEKSSHQGKRILFGLDLLGIPIDLYFICSEKEIQLTVEANRDTRTHKVQDVGLLPGLVSVPDDGASYLVVPISEGGIYLAADIPTAPKRLPIWVSWGTTMPFVGAVRCDNGDAQQGKAALSLITDSAYGAFILSRSEHDVANLDIEYARDPERRRLDVRITVLPSSNHVAIARTYRDKLIADRNHVTLRKKIRERPHVDSLIGSLFVNIANEEVVRDALQRRVSRRIFVDQPEPLSQEGAIGTMYAADPLSENPSRWADMESKLEQLQAYKEQFSIIGSLGGSDWSAVAVDYWSLVFKPLSEFRRISVPLYSVVYHDCVAAAVMFYRDWQPRFLRALINLSLPCYWMDKTYIVERLNEVDRTQAILCELHRLTFSTFLTEHAFLTNDYTVEEAAYSDKTRVLINQSETDTFEREDVALPAQGFYVRHAQMEAHYALRVGDVTFDKPAWRIRRSQDGRPLETSEDVLYQEFPV